MTTATDAGCPFCRIAKGEEPARIVWKDAAALSFLPDVPAVLGHTLVVPRTHVRDIWELDPTNARALADAVRSAAHAVRAATGFDGLNVVQSNGAAAGQTVFHLHVHLVPRTDGDRMPRLWPPDAAWSRDELDRSADALRTAFDRVSPR
ncbi:HIT family protein [Cellulomonas sp. NPDC058312]|uniref:HIT family protein n=1 Tax=Cellulomonas sp. NPDC058312 TaxID=3346441 RepID=UPI0036F09BD8